MKDDQEKTADRRHHRMKFAAYTRSKFTRPIAYVILLILSYALGYLSSSSNSPSTKSEDNTTPTITQPIAKTDLDHFGFSGRCTDSIPPDTVRQTILDRVFNGTSPYLDFPPAHVSPLRRRRIEGWGSTGSVFETLIRRVKPKTIIEVGTFLGASLVHMAGLVNRMGLSTQILCIDDFRGWPGFQHRFRDMKMINGDVLLLYQFIQNVVDFNLSDSVLFMPFSTGSALESLCEWGVFGDLVEVDAGHDFHSAWSDINRAYKIVRKPGGVMFGHDYFLSADNKGVRRAVNLFAQMNGFRVQVDGQHWVIDPNIS